MDSNSSAARLYRGERLKDQIVITVHQGPGSSRPLVGDSHAAEEIDWGRASAGSERLAAALLRDALDGLDDPVLARQLAAEVVVSLPYTEPWVLWSEDLRAWATGRGTKAT